MIVDGKGNMFEDRRKTKNNRRKDNCTVDTDGRRKDDRRKSSDQISRKK